MVGNGYLLVLILVTALHTSRACDTDVCYTGTAAVANTLCTGATVVVEGASSALCTLTSWIPFSPLCAAGELVNDVASGGCGVATDIAGFGPLGSVGPCGTCVSGTNGIGDIENRIDLAKLRLLEGQRDSRDEILQKIKQLQHKGQQGFDQLDENDRKLFENIINLKEQQTNANKQQLKSKQEIMRNIKKLKQAGKDSFDKLNRNDKALLEKVEQLDKNGQDWYNELNKNDQTALENILLLKLQGESLSQQQKQSREDIIKNIMLLSQKGQDGFDKLDQQQKDLLQTTKDGISSLNQNDQKLFASILDLKENGQNWYNQLNLNDETTLQNILTLKQESLEWFKVLDSNDQTLVINQIEILRQQKIADERLIFLSTRQEDLHVQVITTQVIAQYSQALNILTNIAKYFKRIEKSNLGTYKLGTVSLERFTSQALNHDNDGLYANIEIVFQFLTGKGSHFHNGQSVFQYLPAYCQGQNYEYFMVKVTEAYKMYKVAKQMKKEVIGKTTKKAWEKNLYLVQEAHDRACGCPNGFSFLETGAISTLRQQLPVPVESHQDNYRSAALLSNRLSQLKAVAMLDAMNFDITPANMVILEQYAMEDIRLAANLIKKNEFDDLGDVYDGIGRCINDTLNPGMVPKRDFGSLIMVATGFSTEKCQVIDVSSSTSCGNLPSYPFSMAYAAGGVINNTPIICGGWRFSGSPKQQDSCYRFNEASNSWNLHCTMTTRKINHAATVINDSLFISGGQDGSSSTLASTEFIHADGSVTSGPNLPKARYGQCMVTLHDSKVIIIGGYPSSLYKNVLVYDPAKTDNSYTTGPSMKYERKYSACTLFYSDLHNGRPVVLVAGGQGEVTAELYDYTTNSNQWQTIGSLPTSNFNAARALPSTTGNGAYLQMNEFLYELRCTTASCTWSVMEQKLTRDGSSYGVMMTLPYHFTCTN